MARNRSPSPAFHSAEDNQALIRRKGLSTRAITEAVVALILVSSNLLFSFGALFNIPLQKCRCSAAEDEGTSWYKVSNLNPDRKRVSGYSPILDQFDLATSMHTFNGALRDNSSIWRQPPSAEVDAAWDSISAEGYELITVSKTDVILSGKSPDNTLQAPSSWGVGEEQYIAQVEVFHQIHCLNELRKEMNYDYYYSSPPDEVHKAHKAHCLHMLLQSLMCSADVGIITHNWVHNERIPEPKTRPMPDFNVVKKCANFEALLEWNKDIAVQNISAKWPSLRWAPGMKIVPGEGYA